MKPKKSSRKPQADPCEYCNGTVELRQLRVPFHFKGSTIYVDQVCRFGFTRNVVKNILPRRFSKTWRTSHASAGAFKRW